MKSDRNPIVTVLAFWHVTGACSENGPVILPTIKQITQIMFQGKPGSAISELYT